MSDTPMMPLWVSDFLGDTQDLSAAEIGAYMLILMAMWQRGGDLPADPKKLARIARITRGWPKIWAALAHYFEEGDGKLTNKRLTKERFKIEGKRAAQRENGARGGAAKALKTKERGVANATGSPKPKQGQDLPNHNHNQNTPQTPRSGGPSQDDFSEGGVDAEAQKIDQLAEWWAGQIAEKRFIPASSFNPIVARRMLERGLVTEDRLRELGIAA